MQECDLEGNTALHAAAQAGNASEIHRLLRAGAVLNSQNHKCMTPLFLASQYGHNEAVQVLLHEQVDPTISMANGATPLAQNGNADGNQLGAGIDQPTNDGLTPLLIAAENGHMSIVQLLISAKADIHREAHIDGIAQTPLILAAQNGHTEIVRLLLDAGATLDKPRSDNRTALFMAARGGRKETVQLLLSRGADREKSTIKE